MEYKCTICNKSFNSKESLEQHNSMKHNAKKEPEEKSRKSNKKYLFLSLLILAIVLVSAAFYIRSQKPSIYDDFAKCLSEKNAVVYGNDFCQYTGRQLNMFGKSEKYLNYVKCANNKELCDSKQVKITPTWYINGTKLEGEQSFEKLAEISGCKI